MLKHAVNKTGTVQVRTPLKAQKFNRGMALVSRVEIQEKRFTRFFLFTTKFKLKQIEDLGPFTPTFTLKEMLKWSLKV